MPSPEANRRNLERARNPWTERSRDESTLIWRLTLSWWLGTREGRRDPRTQRAWAKQLGISQPYVAKMVRRLKREWLDMADRWRGQPEATLEELRRARERRLAWAAPTRPYEQQPGAQPEVAPQGAIPLSAIYQPRAGAAEALARSGLSLRHWRDVPVVDQLP